MDIYLDNAAMSYPKPEVVYRSVDDYLRNVGASSGRGAYRRALAADQLVYRVRHRTIGTVDRGTLRLGLGLFNTKEEIDCLAEALREIIRERLKTAGSKAGRRS